MKECSEVFGPPPPQDGSQGNIMQMMMKMKSFVDRNFSNFLDEGGGYFFVHNSPTWIQQCWVEVLGHQVKNGVLFTISVDAF